MSAKFNKSLIKKQANLIREQINALKQQNLNAATRRSRVRVTRKTRAARKGMLMPVGPGNNRLGLGSGVSNSSTTKRSQVIEEDEFIADIVGSVGFSTTSFPINPGQSGTFPWGNKIASLYEEYQYEMLEFYYKRTVSEFATNGQAGKVILSIDYDASDDPPTSKIQVEDSDPHVDGMPCTPMLSLKADCAQMRRSDAKYVRPGAQASNTDIKTYDVGNLYVSTYGNTNTSTIGELHVRYRVRLSKPVLDDNGESGAAIHIYNGAGDATAASPLGLTSYTSSVVRSGSTMSVIDSTSLINYNGNTIGLSNTADTVLTLPNSNATWLVYIMWFGTGIAAVPSVTAANGATALSVFNGDITTGSGFFLAAGTNSAKCGVFTTTYDSTPVPGSTNTLTFGGNTSMVGASVDIYVVRLPTTLVTMFTEASMMRSMKLELASLKQLVLKGRWSDLSDEEDEKSSSSSSTAKAPLSNSMLEVIGEYVTRKSKL